MVILYEIAYFSLNSLKSVPLELACTSTIRHWGVPGEKYCRKAPVMETIIQKIEKCEEGLRYMTPDEIRIQQSDKNL